MFERMEVAEQAYKGGKPSKTPTRSEANRAVHVRKLNKGEFNLLTKPKKGRTGKLKTKMQAIRAMRQPEQKIHAYCMSPDTS